MKPRLESAPFTIEDQWLWDWHVTCRSNSPAMLKWHSVESDRRDADIMLMAHTPGAFGKPCLVKIWHGHPNPPEVRVRITHIPVLAMD